MAAIRANQNRDVTKGLQTLLQAYDAGGGSSMYAMATIREEFAKWIPYEHEHFLRHFSMFATEAIALDLRANRFCYPIGGLPPDPNVPIRDTVPYIIPIQLLHSVPGILQPREEEGARG